MVPVREPVRKFQSLVLFPGGKRCDVAVLSMEPSLYAMTATMDGDLAAHCFIAACVWPAPGEPERENVGELKLRRVCRAFFGVLSAAAEAGGPPAVSTPDFYRLALGFPGGLSELFAAYAAKGAATSSYPPR